VTRPAGASHRRRSDIVKVKRLTAVLAMMAAPALGQPAADMAPASAAAPQASAPATQQRFQLRVMEGVLQNAVQQGAQSLNQQLREVSPDISLFSGPARARGFRLEGYGTLFAVDVPTLHRSITWSVRTLTQSRGDLVRALQTIRRMVQAQHDASVRSELERSLRLLEVQVGPPYARPPARPGTVVASSAAPLGDDPPAAVPGAPPVSTAAEEPSAAAPPLEPPAVVLDPSAAYTDAVKAAIVEAMLEYGATLGLAGDEWLTVAARENGDGILAGDLAETVTITLRVRASDLEALKAGRLTREDARRRVEVREF
jgi:hypothetical protein